MTRFSVPDMTCDGCARAITQAVHEVDASATVHVDLGSLTVEITSQVPVPALADAIEAAGFTVRTPA